MRGVVWQRRTTAMCSRPQPGADCAVRVAAMHHSVALILRGKLRSRLSRCCGSQSCLRLWGARWRGGGVAPVSGHADYPHHPLGAHPGDRRPNSTQSIESGSLEGCGVLRENSRLTRGRGNVESQARGVLSQVSAPCCTYMPPMTSLVHFERARTSFTSSKKGGLTERLRC